MKCNAGGYGGMSLVDELASEMIYQMIQGPKDNKEEILATCMQEFGLRKKTHDPKTGDEIQIGNPAVTLSR
jgi:hypothetical protein